MQTPLPHRVAVRPDSESPAPCWRLPTPRELVALVTVVLVVGNALVDSGSLPFPSRPADAPTPPSINATSPAAAKANQLWAVASACLVTPRGVVLPLFDDIAVLGASLLMELRTLDVDLPVEIPHCGDLSDAFLQLLTQQHETRNVRVYDVCELAAAATETAATSDPLFCEDLAHCHARFRSFDIKILALVFSQFQELLLVDADVLFFQSPANLWTLDKYVASGTLFFPDRISASRKYLSKRVAYDDNRSRLHAFVEFFDRSPYRHLANIPLSRPTPRGEPSEYLRETHAWKLRAGHHADSSLLLWNKRRQPRATAILASFVTLHHAQRPPSYGDKELYFLACEVADSHYTFSDFGVGAIGWDAREQDERGVLCGDVLHFFPANTTTNQSEGTSALYTNSDHIASWKPGETTLYRTKARPASLFPGSSEDQQLPQSCAFDIEPMRLTPQERESFRRRQAFYETVYEAWQELTDVGDDKDTDDSANG